MSLNKIKLRGRYFKIYRVRDKFVIYLFLKNKSVLEGTFYTLDDTSIGVSKNNKIKKNPSLAQI